MQLAGNPQRPRNSIRLAAETGKVTLLKMDVTDFDSISGGCRFALDLRAIQRR